MLQTRGWIYDCKYSNGELILAFLDESGQSKRLFAKSNSRVQLEPSKIKIQQLASILAENSLVEQVEPSTGRWHHLDSKETVETVTVALAFECLDNFIFSMKQSGLCKVFNADVHPFHRYLLDNRLDRLGKLELEHDGPMVTGSIQVDSCGPDDDLPPLVTRTIQRDESMDDLQSEQSSYQVLVLPRERFFEARRHLKELDTDPENILLLEESIGDEGLYRLRENARFANLPVGTVAHWGPSRLIDARQIFDAMKQHLLIPSGRTGKTPDVLTAGEIARSERGSLVLSPTVGLHHEVAEFDFESLFPTIVSSLNVGWRESLEKPGSDRLSILIAMMNDSLERRAVTRRRISSLNTFETERLGLLERDAAVKKILVSLCGFSGSSLNRFGDPTIYREMLRLARETVVQAMNIAQKEGFRVLYLDTDSIFVQRQNSTLNDFGTLEARMIQEIGFPIMLRRVYKHLVLLNQEEEPRYESTRRFYGRIQDGTIHCRGIELRRHDYPSFHKKFQHKLITELLNGEDVRGNREKCLALTRKALDLLLSGHVPIGELVISKILGRPVSEYRSITPNVIAAVHLMKKGQDVRRGDIVEYVYADLTAYDPMKRVALPQTVDNYDARKYGEMILDMAETVLGLFGFSRKEFLPGSERASYLEEIRSYTRNMIKMEVESLEEQNGQESTV